MTDPLSSGDLSAATVRVLHVDDDPDFADVAAAFLEREDDRLSVETAVGADEGLERLAATDFDCVVSDYEMPGLDGIEFLEAVRENYPNLPFILYTGKGSEEVASDAISAGVTDYLQKGRGSEQYELLANRVANVVEAHRSRRMLVERTRRLETLISNLPGMVYRCRNDPDWSMETVAGEVEALTGYSADVVESNEVVWGKEIIHPDDQQTVWESVQDALSTDGSFEITYRIVTDDGTTKWVWERGRGVYAGDGTLVALEGFITDVTDRRERERELEQRAEKLAALTDRLEAQYRYLFEEAPVMGVVTRAVDGRPVVEDCNRLFAETLGYEKEEVVGRELAAFYAPESARAMLDKDGYDRALAGEFVREDRVLLTADGETVETLLRAVPRRDVSDAPGTLALYVDVSERRELEREKERLEEFTRVVSHDLRNPMNVAQGRARLAREVCETDHLDAVIRAHERMETLVEDLLTLARSGAEIDEVDPVSLADLARTSWLNVETDGARLDVPVDRTLRADRSRLQQLLENLFRNSVEHGSTSSRTQSDDSVEHGSTGNRSTPDDGADEVTVTVGALDDGTGFYVEDDGPGIPASDREDVFDAGYSTSESGTGFGLSIVRQVAEAHGWEVRATEGTDGGARFAVEGVEFAS